MKTVDIEQAVSTAIAIPVKMSRADKLKHWAGLVRQMPGYPDLFSNLELWDARQLQIPAYKAGDRTPFGQALASLIFQREGLTPNSDGNGSIVQIMNFFEISQSQLHEFSCDCGGAIRKEDMANRIERLA